MTSMSSVADRTEQPVAVSVEPDDQQDRLGLDRVDDRLLLHPAPAPRDLLERAAERQVGSVVEAVTRVLVHRALDVPAGLVAAGLVEEREHFAHHLGSGIVAELLGDRDEPHPDPGEAAHIHRHPQRIAEEAGERAHHDDVVGAVAVLGSGDHGLEGGTVVGEGKGSGFDMLGDDGPAAGGTVGRYGFALIGDGEIARGLPARRDAQAHAGAQLPERAYTRLIERSLISQFFFSVRRRKDPAGSAIAEEGDERADVATTRGHTLSVARPTIAKDRLTMIRDWKVGSFEIADEAGNRVLTVPFSDTVLHDDGLD